MATKLQWVNFPDADKAVGGINLKRSDLVDADVGSPRVMSRRVYVAVRFKKTDRNTVATLTIEPNAKNAAYSATEKTRQPGIFAPSLTKLTLVANGGVAKFPVLLTPAGGDRFKFKARSSKGTEVACRDEIETRRKLYYQVVRMRRAKQIGGAMLRRMESRFWSEDKKVYIKLEQYGAGATIANRINFDDTDAAVMSAVKTALRAAYDRSKAPFAVVALVVNRNCIPKREVDAVPVAFNGGKYHLALNKALFHYADPGVQWFQSMTFTPAAGGGPVNVPRAAVKPVGQTTLEIDTSALPHGAGTLDYSVTVVGIIGMGLSLKTENLVTVACRSLDGSVPTTTLAAILVHEVGHKIGMVPGPQGDPDLDEQSTYYDGRGHSGGHCRHPAPLLPSYAGVSPSPAPKCTMFGDIRTNTTKFCPHCLKSVRKLDLSPERKVGIATQF